MNESSLSPAMARKWDLDAQRRALIWISSASAISTKVSARSAVGAEPARPAARPAARQSSSSVQQIRLGLVVRYLPFYAAGGDWYSMPPARLLKRMPGFPIPRNRGKVKDLLTNLF